MTNMFLKNIMQWKRLSFAGFSLLCMNIACTDKFEAVNTDDHEATEEMMSYDNLKTGSFFKQLQRSVVLFKDGRNLSSDYQVSQGLTSDLYSGYIAPTGSWYNGIHNGSYYFITGRIDKTFRSGFADAMQSWLFLSRAAREQNLPEVAALGLVAKVEAMHRVADAYGPIPYTGFGSGTSGGDYDALDLVYNQFFKELDEAIDVLTAYAIANPSSQILRKYDYVYSGDPVKWIRFANTLRLRLAMRVVYANPTLARQQAEKSVTNVFGVISDLGDRASLKHSGDLVYMHPLFEIAYNFNEGEARMTASMDAYLNGYKDPRISAYFKPAALDGLYHGVRLGITPASWANYTGNKISNLNVDNSSTEIVWMTVAESYFLRAEGALRGWQMGGDAKTFYEQGITMSFSENKVQGAVAYIANSTDKPAAFTDNVGSSNAAAPSDVTIAWEDGASDERKLEKIITQKWIAMYPDGPEGWAEFRRTGYPRLLPVVVNNSNGTINTALQVRRIPYPQAEYNNNASGVKSGIAKLGGPDNGGTKLWWDKK